MLNNYLLCSERFCIFGLTSFFLCSFFLYHIFILNRSLHTKQLTEYETKSELFKLLNKQLDISNLNSESKLDSESKLNSELLNKLLLSCKDINTNLSVIADSMSKKTTVKECKDIIEDNEMNINLQNTEIKSNDTNNLKKDIDENNLNKKVFSNYIDELKSVLQSREKVN